MRIDDGDDDQQPDVDDVGQAGGGHADQEQHVARRRRTPRRPGRGTRAACSAGGSSDREIEDGGWAKPEIVTRTIATQMFEASPYRIPTMPITVKLITIQVPSGRRSMYFAISRLPKTKPSDVRPSWRPYWNSVPPRVLDGERQQQDVPQAEREEDRREDDQRRAQDRRPDEQSDARLEVGDDGPDARRPPRSTIGAILTSETQAAEMRNVSAST